MSRRTGDRAAAQQYSQFSKAWAEKYAAANSGSATWAMFSTFSSFLESRPALTATGMEGAQLKDGAESLYYGLLGETQGGGDSVR